MNDRSCDVQTELAVVHVRCSLEQYNKLLQLVKGRSARLLTQFSLKEKTHILILCIYITHTNYLYKVRN